MPKLAEFYKKGEISLKIITKITNTPHTQVIKKLHL